MPLGSPEDAIRRARHLLGLAETEEGTAHPVRRLDRPQGARYFIVHVGGHVACFDAASGEMMASAETPRSPVTLTQAEARDRAGLGDAASAELVWAPSAASQSMFDPLWEIALPGRRVFVDQRGRVLPALSEKQPGGGPG